MNTTIRPEIVAHLRKQVVARAAEFTPATIRWWVQHPPEVENATLAERDTDRAFFAANPNDKGGSNEAFYAAREAYVEARRQERRTT